MESLNNEKSGNNEKSSNNDLKNILSKNENFINNNII